MAKEPLSSTDHWDEARDLVDDFHTLQQSYYPGNRYPSGYDSPTAYEGPSPDSFQQTGVTLSYHDTISLVHNTIEAARQAMQQSLAGSENIGEAVKIKLTINLNGHNIQLLPDEVVQTFKRDVDGLVLSHNQISHLPYKFSECTSLTYLNLRNNRFKDFPTAICKLPLLQILDLSRNRLNRIPEEIRSMKALQVLSVMNNNLENIPFSLGFLDGLRILKLADNPLNEGLKGVLDGNDGSPSPAVTPLGDSEKEAILTQKIKNFLKTEAAALESGGESSSEGPLDTPRPLKRNTSLRFPVVPTASGSESATDLRSPGFSKPPVPSRLHYRVVSGQNSILHSAALRRPGVTPLIIGNERNRSNSESVLQASQNTRNKRMGMVTRKNPDLNTLDKTRAQRNSFHMRGLSHASVLRDRNVNGIINAADHSPGLGSPAEAERQRGTFVHRLSSLPEHKRESSAPNTVINGAKGLLYSLYQIHPHTSCLINVVREKSSKRSSLERVYYNASTHLQQLDKELHDFDRNENDSRGSRDRVIKNVRNLCRACIVAYQQVATQLLHNISQLVSNGEPMYIRTLLLLMYGSLVEARNSCLTLGIDLNTKARRSKKGIPVIQEEHPQGPAPSATPTKDRPYPTRRLRSETNLYNNHTHSHFNSTSNAQSAVPLYINGRSRSNSRTNTLTTSTSSSVANTPRSGESFLIPGTSQVPPGSHVNSTINLMEFDHDVLFEKIFLDFNECIEKGLRALPQVSRHFNISLEVARSKYASKENQDLWKRLNNLSRYCLDNCEALKIRMSTIKLKEPEVRNSMDFWRLCTRYTGSFVKLVNEVKEAKRLQLVPADFPRTLHPVHSALKVAIADLKKSPWSHVLHANSPPQSVIGPTQWHTEGQANGFINSQRIGNTHRRTRGDSGSGSSSLPYMTSVPATPLSAALGPAAQATIPSTPMTSASLDRSFQGDVFQRAESLLSMQTTILHRR